MTHHGRLWPFRCLSYLLCLAGGYPAKMSWRKPLQPHNHNPQLHSQHPSSTQKAGSKSSMTSSDSPVCRPTPCRHLYLLRNGSIDMVSQYMTRNRVISVLEEGKITLLGDISGLVSRNRRRRPWLSVDPASVHSYIQNQC
ncbi:hypothetical protein BJX70DRAFT_384206 [Aspergillus crustosus]